ncbi:MAG: M50 family metallopeptidase [Nanoarchaeota archaeon]
MEAVDIIIMTFAIGFIFSGYFKKEPLEGYDPIQYYSRNNQWESIKYAAMIAAPAVVLHELAHKFVAISFGATATLHAPYNLYMIVILMKFLRIPLLFFVGGYVAHSPLPLFESATVSVAGPLMNFLMWGGIYLIIHFGLVDKKYYKILQPMAKLSLFLGIFNMLPIPGFDGFGFFGSLFKLVFHNL